MTLNVLIFLIGIIFRAVSLKDIASSLELLKYYSAVFTLYVQVIHPSV